MLLVNLTALCGMTSIKEADASLIISQLERDLSADFLTRSAELFDINTAVHATTHRGPALVATARSRIGGKGGSVADLVRGSMGTPTPPVTGKVVVYAASR